MHAIWFVEHPLQNAGHMRWSASILCGANAQVATQAITQTIEKNVRNNAMVQGAKNEMLKRYRPKQDRQTTTKLHSQTDSIHR